MAGKPHTKEIFHEEKDWGMEIEKILYIVSCADIRLTFSDPTKKNKSK